MEGKTAMYIMIEIVYPLSQENVEAAIEHYFKATGNLLIGRRIFDETGEVLLVVLLVYPHVSAFTTFLKDLLNQGRIKSYEYMSHYLVIFNLDTHLDIPTQMHDFPLRPGESWFSAIDNPQQIYVALERYIMSSEQAAWVLQHQVKWAYFGK